LSNQVLTPDIYGAHWKARPVLPQPLVQNSFFPTKFPCHPNGGKKQENSGKCIGDPTRNRTSLVITLPENLGKFSRVPSMKVSASHICFCFVFLIKFYFILFVECGLETY
jgi:hypothetical protein